MLYGWSFLLIHMLYKLPIHSIKFKQNKIKKVNIKEESSWKAAFSTLLMYVEYSDVFTGTIFGYVETLRNTDGVWLRLADEDRILRTNDHRPNAQVWSHGRERERGGGGINTHNRAN